MLPDKPIDQFTLEDLHRLVAEGEPESERLEFKGSLSTKNGEPDRWLKGGDIGERARNAILSEIVALANAHGGDLILGIAEDGGSPSRAVEIKPLPRGHELRKRLLQMADACIEPRLGHLQAQVIEVGEDGSAAIILRVFRTSNGPHRLEPTGRCYIRRDDRCQTMAMTEIIDLTLKTHRQPVEGLWTAAFGTSVNDINTGVVILDEGRLFGGDSNYFYEGRYEFTNSALRAEFRVVHYHDDHNTIFGDDAERLQVTFTGNLTGETLQGFMTRDDVPEHSIEVVLQRRANLP